MADLLAAKQTIFFKGLLVTAIILAGTSLLYLSLIHRVTKPLEQLSNATRDIARGNLDLRVKAHTRDEVGELATSFNVMVERLKESRQEIEEWNRTLEQRVEERTRSLQQTQKALEGVNEQLVRALNELQETQDQMIQTEKLAAVGQMASTMAHEIKNPLAGIRAALDVVVPELRDNVYAEVLQQILGEVDRLARTTNRLLSFTRPAAPLQVPTSLKELIENTRFLIGQQAKRAGVELRVDLEPPDRPISLDPQLTSQAFLNITLNALQAMDGKGTLSGERYLH
jgi:nitrogen fixation/metabolism regulation signal transduction histidine kinase